MFGGEEQGSMRSVTRSNTEAGAGLLDSASTIQLTVTREFCQVTVNSQSYIVDVVTLMVLDEVELKIIKGEKLT